MTLEQQILQNLVSGITNGAIYALIALGFVAVYSVTGIIHFAQGEFVMLGALLAVSLHRAGLPLAAAGAAAVAGAAVISGVFYRTAIYPARWASVLTLIIITIGGALTVRGVALVLWGTFSYSLPAFTPGLPLRVAGAVIRLQSLWVVGSLLVTMVLLYLFFEHTVAGKALRACAVNMFAARLMGIHPPRAALAAFVLSGALGALAGVLITPIILATYDMGLMLGLKGFVAMVMGGLTNYPAAVAGGVFLGVTEALAAGLIASGYKDAIAFVALLAVLMARPSWIFRAEEVEERA